MMVSVWTALIVGLALVAIGVCIGLIIAGWMHRYDEPPRVVRNHDNIRLFRKQEES